MGKEWLVILMLALATDPVAKPEPAKSLPAAIPADVKSSLPTAPSGTAVPAPGASTPSTQPKCDTRPYRSLIGRTISDVLTMRLPPGTRIYRLGDPVTEPIPPGRLNIEINRGTRVGRIYCS